MNRDDTYCDDDPEPPLLLRGVGLFAIMVTTLVPPSLFVLVTTVVTNAGVLETVCPALLVVSKTTVDCSVVLRMIISAKVLERLAE